MIDYLSPKVLIVSRGVWDDTKGTSSTLTNLFEDYDEAKLAHVYIETTPPNTKCCHQFFQISEFSLIHKLYKWRIKTGHAIDVSKEDLEKMDDRIAQQEADTMSYVRGHRSWFFSFMREVLWAFNGWKSKELRTFITDFSPDIIWLDGSPLILMNRLYGYILKCSQKPTCIFIQDDIYTYKSCSQSLWSKVYKSILRIAVRKIIKQSAEVFVISPKMKREYDEIFGIDGVVITKGIDLAKAPEPSKSIHQPVQMVYMGQVIYGRIYSLIAIAESLKKINNDGIKIQLHIYTNNEISEDLKERLNIGDTVSIEDPVPYHMVQQVISDNDVVLFVESFDPRYCSVARLSFSTKITDYMASGKCILAVGPQDSAPIEYLREEDAALVATTSDEIETVLSKVLEDSIITSYANKARNCAVRNHEKSIIEERVYGRIMKYGGEKNV